MHRAVLFDLDGTLIDSLADIAGAMNAALSERGFPTHSIDDYRMLVGEGVSALVEKSAPPGLADDRLMAAMRREYLVRSDKETRLYPGVHDMLDDLKARGVQCAILSNKPQQLTEKAVKNFLSRWSFWAVLGARGGIPLKPDPAGALEAAEALGLEPKNFLYLGDAGIDMKTAIAAGMKPIGAAWGFREKEELLAAGAEVVIERPEDLIRLL